MEKMPLDQRPCRACQDEGPHRVTVLENGVHYAGVRCQRCDLHLGFLPKPDSDATKYRRENAHRDLVGKFGHGFCEMFLRRQDELPKGQTLEAQHVREYQDGGEPTRENVWIVCTACHRLIHCVRTYRTAVQTVGEIFKTWPS